MNIHPDKKSAQAALSEASDHGSPADAEQDEQPPGQAKRRESAKSPPEQSPRG